MSSAPAGEKDRPAGGGQGVGQRTDRFLGGRGDLGWRHGGQGERRRGRGLHVERHAEQHGAPLGDGDAAGAGQVRGGGGRGAEPRRDRADRGSQRGVVEVEVRSRAGRRGGQDQQRSPALGRLGDAGQRVGQARALVHRQYAELAGHARVGVGHHGGTALVPRGDEAGAARGQRVRDVEVAAADHAEHGPDTRLRQRGADRAGDRGHFSTSASTRAGEPEPVTIGSGAAITTAPVTGSLSRLRSWVRPYLPAPSTS